MAVPDELDLTRFGQAGSGVLADRLEQPIPTGLGDDKRFVDKPRKHLKYAVNPANRRGCLQREPTREHGQPAKNLALVRIEQVVTPVDRSSQRLLTCRDAANVLGQ